MNSGEILELFVSKEPIFELSLDLDGVIGDKFYGKDINRSVLISTIDSYDLAKDNGIDVPIGSLGENILMDYNPYNLPIGSKIKLGTAVVEITQNCTLCKSLTKVNSKLPKLLKDDRGVFVKVVESGVVKIGDRVYVL
jgi:MOSC domain-containing protein YiiM